MFLKEAIWIRDVLAALNLREGVTVLDIGSSGEKYRCLDQPFIDYYMFRPLRNKGIKIIYLDAKKEAGVDMVCDLDDREADKIIEHIQPADVVLCTSLLEHVRNRDLVVDGLKKLVKPQGAVIISVPYIYRYHPDPIDTGYRPSNIELETLFPNEEYTKIASKIIEVDEEPRIVFIQNIFFRLLIHLANRIRRRFNLEPMPQRQTIVKNKVSLVVVRKKQN